MIRLSILPTVLITVLFTIGCSDYAAPKNSDGVERSPAASAENVNANQASMLVTENYNNYRRIDDLLRNMILDNEKWRLTQAENTRKAVSEEVARLITPVTTQSEALAQELAALKQELAATREQIANLGDSSEVLEAIRGLNTEEIGQLRDENRTKDEEIYALKRDRDEAIKRNGELEAQLLEKEDELKDQIELIENLRGSDPSEHPKFKELRDDLNKAKRELSDLKVEKQNLEQQIKDMKAGGAVTPQPEVSTDPLDAYETDFKAQVTLVDTAQNMSTVSFNVICDLQKGDLPKLGDVLSILNDDDEFITLVKVRIVDEEKRRFGAITMTSEGEQPRKPLKGDTVLRAKPVTDG